MDIQKLIEQNERMKKALEFYADRKNYEKPVSPDDGMPYLYEPTPVEKDEGKKARDALS